MMKARSFQKFYLAICSSPRENTASDTWIRCEDKLFRDKDITRIAHNNQNDAQQALLDMTVLSSAHSLSLICIELHTGRKHQIRAQLSSRNYSIAGDKKYGSSMQWEDNAIALHAYMIRFKHPVKDECIEITAPPQKYFSAAITETFSIANNEDLFARVRQSIDKNIHTE
jgi:23S rRNA pseudouridine1911/1915/1917 synthase